MGKPRILVLGGTTEARALAERLAADPRLEAIISLAGRTREPRALPLPTRIGGFGGVDGLKAYLIDERIDLLVDATHPFANQISANAVEAAQMADIPAFALCRPAWALEPGDRWHRVPSVEAAASALGTRTRRVFLAIGRQETHIFASAPQHRYWVRSVDPVDPPLDVPDCTYILASGPFAVEDELAFLNQNRIDVVVSKNSGGSATYGKIEAARRLGIEVIMVERQKPAGLPVTGSVSEALARIAHTFAPE